MSEILEKVKNIRHLPIFPLPLVLFPNEVLPLHIFEDRYRQMMSDIGPEGGHFGVILAEQEGIGSHAPNTGSIGCVAEVREAVMLPDGRSNIVTVGLTRFRLLDHVDEGSPYLVGDVVYFEDEAEPTGSVGPLASEVLDLFGRMAKAAFRISGSRGQMPEINETDPQTLTFLIAAAFSFDNAKKYELLEITSTSKRLSILKPLLIAAVEQMEESSKLQEVSRTNGHSSKKIDL
jgi:Lon protease-like protein